MLPIIFAFITALGYAASDTLGRVGLKTSSPFTGALLSSVANTVLLWAICLATVPGEAYQAGRLWVFLLDGIFVQALARLLLYIGMSKVGLPRTSAILSSTPLFNVLIAVLFLGETLTLGILAGAALIALGISQVAERGPAVRSRMRDLAFPLGTALLYGLSPNLRKFGLVGLDYPVLGAAISVTMSIPALFVVSSPWAASRQMTFNRHALAFFTLSGAASAVGLFSYFYAIKLGQVVIVGPLAGVASLFVALFTYLFLKKLERMTGRLVLGAAIVVAGSFAIVLG